MLGGIQPPGNASGVVMKEITVRALAVAALYSLVLAVGASLLAGCTPAKVIFHCTVTNPQNCN